MTQLANNIDWMTAKGWLKDAERQLLFELASRLPGYAVIVNVGNEYGASLACLRAGNPKAYILGIDLDNSKLVSDYDCSILTADSHLVAKDWADHRKIDLAFIDGDHGELGVFLDAKFADFLPVGGHILFQDVYDWDKPGEIHGVCPGVYYGVEKWLSQPHIKLEFEELPSVETTRVFKRVKEHEQPGAGVADSGSVDSYVQQGEIISREPEVYERKPQIQRGNKSSRGG